MNYYEMLGVSREAETEVVTAAYRAMARKYHPDVNRDPSAEDRLKALNEAYDILRDPDRRAAYDASLGGDARSRATSAGPTIDVAPARKADVLPPPAIERSFLSDVFFVILGIPIMWVLGMFMAHVIYMWLITVALEWMGAGDYSVAQAFHALGETITHAVEAVQKQPADDARHSLIVMAFSVGWMFMCSAAASSAIVSHAVEERPHLSLWLVYTVLLIVATLVSYRGYLRLGSDASFDALAEHGAITLALLAGIVSSRTAIPKRRPVEAIAPEAGGSAIAPR